MQNPNYNEARNGAAVVSLRRQNAREFGRFSRAITSVLQATLQAVTLMLVRQCMSRASRLALLTADSGITALADRQVRKPKPLS